MESTEQYTADAGTVTPETQPAAVENVTTTDTETVTPEVQPAAAEVVSAEVEGEVAAEPKKDRHKTLEERAEEIADRKIQQRIAEMEQRKQQEAPAKPDFVPLDDAGKARLNQYVARLYVKERQLQDELAYEPENTVEIVQQIRAIQQQRSNLESEFQTNEAKQAAWQQQQQVLQQQQETNQRIQYDIDIEFDNEMKARGIDAESAAKGRDYLSGLFKTDPALHKKFNDIVTHKTMYQGFSGVSAAVAWGTQHVIDNVGKAAAAERLKREAGKEKTLGGGAGGGGDVNISSFSELLKLPSAEINRFAKEHPQKFQNLKEKHFK